MSQYKKLVTTFRNFESLKKALSEIGYGDVCEFSRIPTKPELTLMGYGGTSAGQKASIRFPRSKTHGFEDTGFFYNPQTKTFDAVISTHDNYLPGHRLDFGDATLKRLSQRYSVNEAKRVARTKGYRINETTLDDGSIKLECVAYR